MQLEPKEIAQRIRDKVADLNDELILAAAADVQVELALGTDELGSVRDVKVWCSQEVR